MKRPLFLSFAGLVLGEAAAMAWGKDGGVYLAFGLLPGIFLPILWRRLRSPFFILGILWLGIGYGVAQDAFSHGEPVEGLSLPLKAEMYGRVLAVTEQEDRYSLIVEQAELSSVEKGCIRGNCLVYAQKKKPVSPGTWVLFQGELCALEKPTNPGQFRGDVYDRARGIYSHFFAKKYEKIKEEKWAILRCAYVVREKIKKVYGRLLGRKEAALLQAMILGDKGDLDDCQKRDYGENGVAHLLAVSGLHVSIVAGGLYHLLRNRGVSYFFSCSAGWLLLLFYGVMTGFGNSVLRAVLMYAGYLCSQYLGAHYDLPSAMGMAGILMLLESPWRLLEGGFQISFWMVTVIGFVLPEADALFVLREKKPEGLWAPHEKNRLRVKKAIYDGGILWGLSMPLLLRLFFTCSPYSLILNLILLPLMTPLMLGGLLCGLAGMVSLPLAYFPAVFLHGLLELFSLLLSLGRKLPGSLLVPGCPSPAICLLLYGLELGGFALWYFRKYRELMAGIVLVLCLVFCFSGAAGLSLTGLDVGQGDCFLIETPSGKAVLVDGGSSSRSHVGNYIIEPALKFFGVSVLDAVIVTHGDDDHVNGLGELLDKGFPVKRMLLPKGMETDEALRPLLTLVKRQGTEVIWMEEGMVYCPDEQVRFTCLHPAKNFSAEDRNAASLVFHIGYKSFDALLTGDLEAEGEDTLCHTLHNKTAFFQGRLELLKVAHHGSRFSTSAQFLEMLRPETALISVGKNNRYGHPHGELLERLEKRGVSVWRTDERGAIRIETDGERWKISSYRLPFPME